MLSAEDVARLAHQARFSLSPDELERFRAQLTAVLRQMDILAELESADPAHAPDAPAGARLRADDGSADKLELPLEKLSANLTAGFFTVPRIIGDGRTP